MALYQRYRPEAFQDVIGQSQVTEPLKQSLKSGSIHHAYLFSGPRGCGKTTSARILARCLNCEQGPTDTPCGVCQSCLELSRSGGGSLDVVEIDAASHNGVDDARQLRERAVFAPARDRFKVFILDEAHMVTQQGFNALLKIVEEPPDHVKFIFATTEPEKVLTTIRSRTHHYPFRLVSPRELVDYLGAVASSEGIGLDEGVLSLVVQSGGGSVRDSLSLLDQLKAGSKDGHIFLSEARALLGYTPRSTLSDLVGALAKKSARDLFMTVSQALEAGHDPRRLVEDLLAHLRDLVVVQAVNESVEDLFPDAPNDELSSWRKQAKWFSPNQLSALADEVNDVFIHMAGVTSPTLQVELLAARLLAVMSPASEPVDTENVISVAPPLEHYTSATSHLDKPLREDDAAGTPPDARETDVASNLVQPFTTERALELWPAIVDEVSRQKRSLWVALSTTKPLSVEGDVLTIGFVRRADAEILKKPQGPGSPLPNADLVRDAVEKHSGHRVRFTVGDLDNLPQTSRPNDDASGQSPQPALQEIDDSAEAERPENSQREKVRPSLDEAPSTSQTAPIATRGEPVVRQILGGELGGEEFLEQMSDQGETDV